MKHIYFRYDQVKNFSSQIITDKLIKRHLSSENAKNNGLKFIFSI